MNEEWPEGRPRKDRTWLYIGLAFVAIWAGYLAFVNPLSHREGAPALTPARDDGTRATDSGWVLQDLDGKPVEFSTFRGRPILLNIWATWCPPCRAEMPTLVRLAANPRLKGVAFLAVTNEPASDKVKQYAQSEMQGLTVLRSVEFPPVFTTEGIPATFLIGPDGKLATSEVGAAHWDDPSVVDYLEKLLKAGAPPRP